MEEVSDFLGIVPEMGAHCRGGYETFQKGNFGGLIVFQDTEDAENFLGLKMADMSPHLFRLFWSGLPLQTVLPKGFKCIDMPVDFSSASDSENLLWISSPSQVPEDAGQN